MSQATPRSILLTMLAFMVVSFGVQATSHFVLNAEHYASISIMRPDPMIPLGIAAMVIQGGVAAILFPLLAQPGAWLKSGLFVGWGLMLFLGSYIVLVEPSKYLVPSVSAWMLVEASASFIQFTLFGLGLGLIHAGLGVRTSSVA